MVDLMLEHIPDHPLPRAFAEESLLSFAQEGWRWETLPKISGSPAGKGIGKHVPGGLKSGNQFGGRKRGRRLVVPRVPSHDGGKIGTPFAHPPVEPPDTVGNEMLRNHPYLPVM